MWIPVIIIVLAMALAVGPVMWLKPTAREKRMAACRSRAAELGMRVSMVSVARLGNVSESVGEQGMLACYGLPWDKSVPAEEALLEEDAPDWCLLRTRFSHGANFAGDWDWQSGSSEPAWPALRDFVSALGEEYVLCRCSHQGLSLGWLEKGGVEQVDLLNRLLQQLKDICLNNKTGELAHRTD